MVAIMLLGTSNIINVTFVITCINIFHVSSHDGISMVALPIQCANRARKSVYFLRKTKMAEGRFLVFRRALLGRSVFSHVAPSRTLYGRGFKAL